MPQEVTRDMGPIPVAATVCGEITQLMHLRFIDELPDLQLVTPL